MDLVILILAWTAGLATAGMAAFFNLGPARRIRQAAAAARNAAAEGRGPSRSQLALLGLAGAWLGFLAVWAVVVAVFDDVIPNSAEVLVMVLLTRFSVLAGVLLVVLVPLSLWVLPGVLRNTFVLRGPVQLFNVTWIALLTAAMTVVTARVVEFNAGDRFGEEALSWSARFSDWTWFGVRTWTVLGLGLPAPLTCLVYSLWSDRRPLRYLRWLGGGVLAILLGTAVAAGMVFGVAVLQNAFLDRSVQIPGLLLGQTAVKDAPLPRTETLYGVANGAAWAAHFLDPYNEGLVQRLGSDGGAGDHYQFFPGHLQTLTAFLTILVIYVGGYFAARWWKWTPREDTWFSPLHMLLLILLLSGFLLQGMAFALDRYHFPTLLAVGLSSFGLSILNRTDHFFFLRPAPAAAGGAAPTAPPTAAVAPAAAALPPTLHEAAGAWQVPAASRLPPAGPPTPDGPKSRRTLVAVTASGGGIQAAAWTARVLVGLHERYGDDFSRSVGLVSAVSGGSVGAMYYLDRRLAGVPAFDAGALRFNDRVPDPNSICGRAMASSLEATAWGLAYPDLLRVIFPPLLYHHRDDDRGARNEVVWASRLSNPDVSLMDWAARVRAGTLPIPVFNATTAETGQRFLASPVVDPSPANPVTDALQLLQLYPDADPRVCTAVRLSATFPYVSPICRPAVGDCPEAVAYHYCDGGYVDNEGMITVIDWLTEVLRQQRDGGGQQTFDQILLVRLMPFPVAARPDAEPGRGWFYAVLGPIDGLLNVRVSSQAERNDLAVRQFIARIGSEYGVRAASAAFTYELESGAYPPLSWMLTDPQKADVEAAWGRIVARQTHGDPLAVLDGLFG